MGYRTLVEVVSCLVVDGWEIFDFRISAIGSGIRFYLHSSRSRHMKCTKGRKKEVKHSFSSFCLRTRKKKEKNLQKIGNVAAQEKRSRGANNYLDKRPKRELN